MEIKKIKAIIFDFDGTLANTDELVIRSYREVFKTFRPDYKLTESEEISFLGPTLEDMFKKYFKEDFITLLNVYHNYAFKNTKKYAFLYPHVEQMLSILKKRGYIVGLITSRFRDSLYQMLDNFPLEKYFDVIITLDEVSKPKPSPEGINFILNKYNLKNNELIYIGDNNTDYQACKNAHVYSGLVSWSRGRNNALNNPDLLINDFKEVIDLFKGNEDE